MRILILCCDEGAAGFSTFCFLSSYGCFRILFHRDPLHRLSNLFVNTLRGVPQVFHLITKLNIVHKYMRAPYGGHRFLNEAKGALRYTMEHGSLSRHPLVGMYLENIARDRGTSVDNLNVRSAAFAFLNAPSGQTVEMRRWSRLFQIFKLEAYFFARVSFMCVSRNRYIRNFRSHRSCMHARLFRGVACVLCCFIGDCVE